MLDKKLKITNIETYVVLFRQSHAIKRGPAADADDSLALAGH